jgi:hypothetical protein
MPTVTYDSTGEHEVIASLLTLSIYEQEFSTDEKHADLIADVYGVIDLTNKGKQEVVTAEFVKNRLQEAMDDGKTLPKTTRSLIDKAFPVYVNTEVDYTMDNWDAYPKALWAMLRTADEVNALRDPSKVQGTPLSYKEWLARTGNVDLHKISEIVISLCQTAFFPA